MLNYYSLSYFHCSFYLYFSVPWLFVFCYLVDMRVFEIRLTNIDVKNSSNHFMGNNEHSINYYRICVDHADYLHMLSMHWWNVTDKNGLKEVILLMSAITTTRWPTFSLSDDDDDGYCDPDCNNTSSASSSYDKDIRTIAPIRAFVVTCT